MSQFVADFEAYIPAEFNGEAYGKAGVLATMDEAGIDTSVVFMGGLPNDPREGNAELLREVKGEARILPGALINPTMGPLATDDLKRCVNRGARTAKLMAAAHRYHLDSACVDPIMALAESLGIPATIHSGSPMSGCSPEYIGDARHTPSECGNHHGSHGLSRVDWARRAGGGGESADLSWHHAHRGS